jgi:microcystin-dependent protein
VVFLLGDTMPIPSSINDLDTNPNNNSPQGSESVGPNANGYLQALGAFIKQIYNGSIKPLTAVDVNGQKITNGAPGVVSTTSKDFVLGSQIYIVGEVRYWYGPPTEAAVVGAWPVGWHYADGTHGTPDLRDRFLVGAGLSYPNAAVGGAATVSLSIAQLPAHNHGINDPGHAHGVAQNPHGHGVNDPGHAHSLGTAVPNNIPGSALGLNGTANSSSINSTQVAGTGVSIAGAYADIAIASATTGISGTQNTGSGVAHENRPPYFALVPIYYTGAA